MQLYQWHPMAVHFPIVFLLAGGAVQIVGLATRRPGLHRIAAWHLWIGALSLWAALGLGVLAERTAPHVPLAWEMLHEHRELGFWTAGLFSALALARLLWRSRLLMLQTAVWLIAAIVLVSTAWHGGELVYRFGMGVFSGE